MNQSELPAARIFLKECIEDVLDDIIKLPSWVERKKALVNILWLLKREDALQKADEANNSTAVRQFNLAINAALPKFTDSLIIFVDEPNELTVSGLIKAFLVLTKFALISIEFNFRHLMWCCIS